MQRLSIITISILYSCFALATPGYQIDLIIFSQQTTGKQNTEQPSDAPLIPMSKNAIPLKIDSDKSARLYHLLSNSNSDLRDEYYLLSHKAHYQILGHYSWRQPANNQSMVSLPVADHNGWQMQGTLRVRKSNYYMFDAELQLAPPDNPQSSFTVIQKQRLKDNVVYYLDNSHAGILVKIHKLT